MWESTWTWMQQPWGQWTPRDTYLLGATLMLAAGSIITRTIYYVFGAYVPLNESTRRALRYAPGAALAAIIIPGLFPLSANGTMTVSVDQLFAAATAIVVFFRTRNTLLVIAIGMLVFWGVRFLFSLLSGA